MDPTNTNSETGAVSTNWLDMLSKRAKSDSVLEILHAAENGEEIAMALDELRKLPVVWEK